MAKSDRNRFGVNPSDDTTLTERLNSLRRELSSIDTTDRKDKHSPYYWPSFASAKPEKIDELTRQRKITNDNLQKDQDLKISTLKKLFYFLSVETVLIFGIAIAQGIDELPFFLDEWSFRLLLLATIGQITYMLTIAVQHLFPTKK